MITVYGKPGCQRCKLTTLHLSRFDVPFTYRDVSTDLLAADTVSLLGYKELPIVVAGDVHWSGFRIVQLNRLIEIYQKQPSVAEMDQLDAAAIAFLVE